MAWISASWQYILSTPLAVSEGGALGDLAAVTSVWASSQLTGVANSMASAWVEAMSTIRSPTAPSVGSC
jgi:hypothetical protein